MLDRYRDGTAGRKLTDKQVRNIFLDRRKLVEIAADYGVTHNCICSIQKRKLWAAVTSDLVAIDRDELTKGVLTRRSST